MEKTMPDGPVTAMNATARPDPIPLLADGDTLGVVGMGVMGCTILKGLLAAGALPPERVWGTSRSAAISWRSAIRPAP